MNPLDIELLLTFGEPRPIEEATAIPPDDGAVYTLTLTEEESEWIKPGWCPRCQDIERETEVRIRGSEWGWVCRPCAVALEVA